MWVKRLATPKNTIPIPILIPILIPNTDSNPSHRLPFHHSHGLTVSQPGKRRVFRVTTMRPVLRAMAAIKESS